MQAPDIVIHPNVTMRKYHEGEGEPHAGWTAQSALDGLRRRLPDTHIVLAASEDFSAGKFAATRVLLAGVVTPELLSTMPRLEWLQFIGSGSDHFFKASKLSPDDFRRQGVRVLNSPGISKFPVAEHVMAMMLALARGIPRAVRQQARREWTVFPVKELRGKTLGIIGLGEIGERVAAQARAFDMYVIGCKRQPAAHRGNAHVVVSNQEMRTVVTAADYLVLLAPLSEATRGLFNYEMFSAMKRTSSFINVSRGENVIEGDLVRALKEGLIASAAVDTFGPLSFDDPKKLEALSPASELWDLPNMLVVPNNAASADCYMEYFADAVADNYRRWRAGEPFRSVAA